MRATLGTPIMSFSKREKIDSLNDFILRLRMKRDGIGAEKQLINEMRRADPSRYNDTLLDSELECMTEIQHVCETGIERAQHAILELGGKTAKCKTTTKAPHHP